MQHTKKKNNERDNNNAQDHLTKPIGILPADQSELCSINGVTVLPLVTCPNAILVCVIPNTGNIKVPTFPNALKNYLTLLFP